MVKSAETLGHATEKIGGRLDNRVSVVYDCSMTARQFIRNLLTLDDIDAEIPCRLIVRDANGNTVTRSEDGEYVCYLSITNKMLVEKCRP